MPLATSIAYLTALALMGLFVQTLDLWQALALTLGRDNAALLPFVGLGLVVAATAIGRSRPWLPVAGALVLAGAALALTDPAFPAKRIHVAEYILLSLVIRQGAGKVAAGLPLTLTVAVLTALLGVHDELVQGLHPGRTFGSRDMLVDGVAALAGALLGHVPAAPGRPAALGPWAGIIAMVVAGLLLELWAVAVTITPGADVPPPLWAAAPVLGTVCAGILLAPSQGGWPAHLGRMTLLLAGTTPLYLVIAHGVPLAFR